MKLRCWPGCHAMIHADQDPIVAAFNGQTIVVGHRGPKTILNLPTWSFTPALEHPQHGRLLYVADRCLIPLPPRPDDAGRTARTDTPEIATA